MLTLSMCSRTASAAGAAVGRRTNSVLSRPQIPEFCVSNEPILEYRRGSSERNEIASELERIGRCTEDIPIVIGGEEIRDGTPRYAVAPHNHQHKIAQFYYANEKIINKAIDTAVQAQAVWDRCPLEERVRIWLCAAELMSTKYRQSLNAATMAGQSKSVIQAEIDSAAELIDFTRFNAYFLKENANYQPISENPNVTLNSIRFRGIDGFVAAISPFNFTAIGGNLAYTPALMGNGVLWKPSDTAILSNWRIFNIMREAGVPDGLVNFVPADGPVFGAAITKSRHLAAINFTGSVPTFNWIWDAVGKNLPNYINYPRLIGECGGKNFHFIHPSADVESAVACTIRAAFEYCGQKCSACSRLYIPRSLYKPIVDGLLKERQKLKVGDVSDFSVFMGAVIDEKAFSRISQYIENAKKNSKNKILGGGKFDKSKGYFIEPTIIETTDPQDKLMQEEIFGPVLTLYTYEDKDLQQAMKLPGCTTIFALTGAVFAQDKQFLCTALDEFRMTCGNFYINDKSTGAVVNQQPFGGGRMSGTNDKAGSPFYLMRFTSPQSVKETFEPMRSVTYPYMLD